MHHRDTSETIATRLRALIDRHDDGAIDAAADRIGIERATLHRILDGELRTPEMETLEAIVRTYDCDATWLLSGVLNLSDAGLRGRPLADATHVLYELSQNLTYRRRQAERKQQGATGPSDERDDIHVA